MRKPLLHTFQINGQSASLDYRYTKYDSTLKVLKVYSLLIRLYHHRNYRSPGPMHYRWISSPRCTLSRGGIRNKQQKLAVVNVIDVIYSRYSEVYYTVASSSSFCFRYLLCTHAIGASNELNSNTLNAVVFAQWLLKIVALGRVA